ncbi:MAG: tRNA (adenosine(37)-N6)-threonylcarbamoyltransferase complex ATPase subunit type 1 TsaE [Candidatus Omnitrophica bacterium]|nr:tRNA (adenosine(37)-N6)-threonylcarbamoyltransferase complex ATPase subunit type 1 TsaE [Candidatus Omnitrophota bacterium]
MKPYCCLSHNYEETLALGVQFARSLKKGDIVCLYGDLGAGKTAFVKGMAKGLKLDPVKVHSPTFTLMNVYDGKVPLYHFDLYRINAVDLFGMGYEEFFYGKGIAAVEWSEKLEGLLPEFCWKVELQHAGDDQRQISISCQGKELDERQQQLKERLT